MFVHNDMHDVQWPHYLFSTKTNTVSGEKMTQWHKIRLCHENMEGKGKACPVLKPPNLPLVTLISGMAILVSGFLSSICRIRVCSCSLIFGLQKRQQVFGDCHSDPFLQQVPLGNFRCYSQIINCTLGRHNKGHHILKKVVVEFQTVFISNWK